MSNKKKTKKWEIIDGQIFEVKEGKTASDLVTSEANKTFDEMEQPIVDSLKAKDAGYISSRREHMAESIDRKRIANQLLMLEEEKRNFIEFLVEASRAVETQQKELEAQVIKVEEVKVVPFEEMLAAKLGGALTSSTSAGELPEGNKKGAKNKLEGLM